MKPLRGKQVEQPKLERRDLRIAGPLIRRCGAVPVRRLLVEHASGVCCQGARCIRGCGPYSSPSRTSRPAGTATLAIVRTRGCASNSSTSCCSAFACLQYGGQVGVLPVLRALAALHASRVLLRSPPCRVSGSGADIRVFGQGCASRAAAAIGRLQRFEAFGLPLRADLWWSTRLRDSCCVEFAGCLVVGGD